jgi:ATP-dependent Zn protease
MKTKLIITAIAVSITLMEARAFADEGQYLTYDEFIRRVDAGNIKEVRLAHPTYSSVLGSEIVDGKERAFRCYHATGPSEDPLLIRLLKEKGVAVTIQTQKDERSPAVGAMISGFAMMVVPLVILVYVIVIQFQLRKLVKHKES